MQSLCTLRSHRHRWTAQHSLPSGRYSLLGPDFHRLDRTSFSWRTRSGSPRLGAGARVEDEQVGARRRGEIEHGGDRAGERVHGAVARRGSPQLSSMKRAIEVWSVSVWSTWFCLANGEMTMSGMRVP
jgi:hypothetical protein